MSNILQIDAFYKNLKQPHKADANQIGHFNIFRVEDLLLPKHKQLTYSRRSFFKISLVTGHSKIHYADKCVEVTDSVLVFTNPMVPYQWEVIGEQQSGYVCIFTEAFLNRHENINNYPVFQSAANAVIALNTADAVKYNQLFLRMYDELQGDYAYKYDLLRNLLMEIIHSAQKMQPVARNISKGPNASERIAALFNELLERQFPVEMAGQQIKIHTPAAFAAQLNIHVNHLNKALKEITGHNTSQLLAGRLLQEAKVLLKSTNWTIAEIAWGLGFEEPNHFSSFFKNHADTTPNRFRQAVLEGV